LAKLVRVEPDDMRAFPECSRTNLIVAFNGIEINGIRKSLIRGLQSQEDHTRYAELGEHLPVKLISTVIRITF
jgi:hypothetical protein